MASQSELLRQTEANAWYARNKDKLGKKDTVTPLLCANGIHPTAVLEIGCADGWRLEKLHHLFNCDCAGIDLSEDAILAAEERHVADGRKTFWFDVDDASDIPYVSDKFDLVILGFFLYLVDRNKLFQVVAEADRVLKDGGHLVVHDFFALRPHSKTYRHHEKLFTYKMGYAGLFLANPAYSCVSQTGIGKADDDFTVLLKKDIKAGWPLQRG